MKTPKEVVAKSGTRAVAIVPARAGSRRVPRKNLSIIGGKTLVRRALETAVAARCFDAVCLSSDDEEILAEAADLPVHVVLRPAELAGDDALAYDVVVHALADLERRLERFDVVAIVQATSPFTTPDDLAGAMALLDRTGAPSVVSVGRIEASEHPLKLKVLDGDRLRPYLEDDRLLPSQFLPPLWKRNGSVYVSRREVIDAGALLSEVDIRGYEMPPERSLDIDTPRDLALAQLLAEQHRG